MFKIYGGLEKFTQWTKDQKLIMSRLPIGSEVLFYNDPNEDKPLVSQVYEITDSDGNKLNVCEVPSILLTKTNRIKVCIPSKVLALYGNIHMVAGQREKYFEVEPASKPDGYVYDEIPSAGNTSASGGASVQSDWSVNDETDPAYVKNRTHYMEVCVDVEWGGDTESRDFLEMGTMKFYKVAEAIPMDVINSSLITVHCPVGSLYDETDVTISTEDSLTIMCGDDVAIGSPGDGMFFVNAENDDGACHQDGNVIFQFPSGGLYFGVYNPSEDKVQIIADKLKCTRIEKIDNLYINGIVTKRGTGKHSEIFNDRVTNIALGNYSHAEGHGTVAYKYYSHAEGYNTVTYGSGSHAEGHNTVTYGSGSHSEGYRNGSACSMLRISGEAGTKLYTLSGGYTIPESHDYIGCVIQLNSDISKIAKITSVDRDNNIIGVDVSLNKTDSISEVSASIFANGAAVGMGSHSEGNSLAIGTYSHSEGQFTIAGNNASHSQGKYNKRMIDGGSDTNTVGDAMVIGNGTSVTNRSNAFRVTFAGETYGLSAFNSSGADYAEFFEWADFNPDAEDRVGYFVTLDGKKIRIANTGDYILGVVSGQPCIIGNSDEDWLGRWEHDEFGRFIKEEVETPVTEMRPVEVPLTDANGNQILNLTKTEMQEVETGEVIKGWRYKANPDYDNTQKYVERKDRQEWDCVGMLGVLAVRDDGTCEVNGFCSVADGGTATKADDNILGMTYRVMERVSENVVKIVFR